MNKNDVYQAPRRTGETTRTVDQAIQSIFKLEHNGIIIVPGIMDHNLNGFHKAEQIIIDEAAYSNPSSFGEIQKGLREKIMKRIVSEHTNVVFLQNEKTDFGKIQIINK